MTVGTTVSKVVIEGNGITTVFSYNFIMPNAGYAVVIVTDGTGTQTVIPASQYLITGIGNPAGGTVTYPLPGPPDNPTLYGSPIPAGATITIERFVPYIQFADVAGQGPTFAAIEQGLDNLEYQIQQINDAVTPVASALTFGIVKPDNLTVTILNGVLSAVGRTGGVAPGTTNSLAYYSVAGSTVSPLGTANSGVLVTSAQGTPSISGTLPTSVQLNITKLGTVATGVWQGTVIDPTYLPVATNAALGIVKPDNATIVISGGVLSTAGGTGSGSVTSVGLSASTSLSTVLAVSGSPVTSSGTLSLALVRQAANLVFAGPTTGSSASPSFRSITASDLPVATTASLGIVRPDNTTITIANGILSAASGSGTGNVVGPASSITSSIAIYADGTGKLLSDPTSFTTSQSIFINPGVAGTASGVGIVQTGTGTVGTNGFFQPNYAFNFINISNSDINAGGNNVWGLAVSYNFGSSVACSGAQTAIYGVVTQLGPTASANPQKDYVGVQGIADIRSADGGGSGTEKGAAFGMNAQAILEAAATHYLNVTGIEVDVACYAGSSVKYKTAMQVNYGKGSNANDAVQGSSVDCVIALGSSNGPKSLYGIQFTPFMGQFPLAATATMFGVANGDGGNTVALGIDLSNVTCSVAAIKLASGQANGILMAGTAMLWENGSKLVCGADFRPSVDNASALGNPSFRWSTVYCTQVDIIATASLPATLTLDATASGGDTWTVRARTGGTGSGFELLDNAAAAFYLGPNSTITADGQTALNIQAHTSGSPVFRTILLEAAVGGHRALYVNA